MKLTIENASQFRDEFRQCGRADQFSYEALGLLFDYFEEIDPDYELDVIAICCEYSEGTAWDELASDKSWGEGNVSWDLESLEEVTA